MSVKKHKKGAPDVVRIGVISVSTTRSIENDESGKWIVEKAIAEGHNVLVHKIVKDDENEIRSEVLEMISGKNLNVVLLTGGTGITSQDVTIDALHPLFSKLLSGFASMFTVLSYKEIGSSAIMSRATAGIIGKTAVFCMPGSKKACELACQSLIFPELGHIALHI